MSRNIKINRGQKKEAGMLVLLLCAAVVASALLAGVWQVAAAPIEENFLPVYPADIALKGVDVAGDVAPSSPPASVPPASESESTSSANAVLGERVPAGERVRSEYFDDAVFVGDSLTTGITLYDVMANTTVYASTGINLDTVFTKEVVKINDTTMTIFDALKSKDPAKIYVMLGANSISQMSDEWVFTQYDKLMKSLKEQHPDAVIYIQSVLPIHEATFAVKYNGKLTNAKIDQMNTRLMAMAAENGLLYLDVASIFKDENNGLPQEATPDGLHIKSEQYIMWFDYLKMHTVQK